MSEEEKTALAVADRLGASLTVAAAARQLRKSPQWLYNEIWKGRVHAMRSGSRVFVEKKEVYRLLLSANA